ncbi:hypothetical protein PCANC_25685 [Puccinia coronata f. sp. avenae]|uniref:U6 snRNA phosphodiesterase 1 n=1 Tax=Puccinia coronata f. sp. avenae TaxID=200324 RepID=A0A2N5TAB5_9BASI|nr:hypothetical protein PCANC_25685 [Puccinia coronata f. sp. avenae]
MEKKSTTESTPQVEKSPSGIKQKRKLPEPSFNNSTNVKSSTNDPSLHQGRKRSRPQIDGDWPTHIYIPINFEEKSQEILQKVIKKLAQEDKSNVWHSLIEKNTEVFSLHLSLSRPSFLKTDERDDFINQMRKFIGGVDLFGINFSNFSTLENDNLTRGFLVLEVGTGHSHLNLLVAQINRVLKKEVQLP